MLDFGEEVVKFKLKGKVHEVQKPSNGQIKTYASSLKKCKTNDSKEEALIVWLEELGLSREAYYELRPNQLKQILDSLYEAEKN